jgi:hypothetical protein
MTRGLLHRQLVAVRMLAHVGKESNLLEEGEAGLVHAQEEVRSEYSDRRRDAGRRIVIYSTLGSLVLLLATIFIILLLFAAYS